MEYTPGAHATGFKGNEPWIDGVTINCRTLAVVSRFGLAVAWDGGEVLDEYAAWAPESAEKMEDIDPERAEEAMKRAEERLAEARAQEEVDRARAKAALDRAMMRIKIAGI